MTASPMDTVAGLWGGELPAIAIRPDFIPPRARGVDKFRRAGAAISALGELRRDGYSYSLSAPKWRYMAAATARPRVSCRCSAIGVSGQRLRTSSNTHSMRSGVA
jgi:hypothetical protein